MKSKSTSDRKWAEKIRAFTKTQKSQVDAAHAIGVKIDRFQSWLYAKHIPDEIVRDEIESRIEAVIAARN